MLDPDDYETGYMLKDMEVMNIMSNEVLDLKVKQIKNWIDSGYMTFDELLETLGVYYEYEDNIDMYS